MLVQLSVGLYCPCIHLFQIVDLFNYGHDGDQKPNSANTSATSHECRRFGSETVC